MNELLQKAKGVRQEGCVTITMNTHVTQPDKTKDPIVLKKLVKEAEERLYDTLEKRSVWPIMENLNKLADSIDNTNNLASLVIFANADFADYTRLPISVTDMVVIDDTFHTREIVRAMQQQFSYYILVLNRHEARLLEALDDKLVREIEGEFPLENPLVPYNKLQESMKEGSNNLIAEFFNQVDKALWDAVKDDPKTVILATEERNYDYYRDQTDQPDMILGYVQVNGDKQPAHQIITNAWKETSEMMRQGNIMRLEEIEDATGAHRFEDDLSAIWNAIQMGRADTLFVRKGFHQPARIAENPDDGDFTVLPTGENSVSDESVKDDIIDYMVEVTLDTGGEVVFIDSDDLEKYGNVALITRFAYPEPEMALESEQSDNM